MSLLAHVDVVHFKAFSLQFITVCLLLATKHPLINHIIFPPITFFQETIILSKLVEQHTSEQMWCTQGRDYIEVTG